MRRLLRSVDTPRAPRPEFERALRAQLFDPQVVPDYDEPIDDPTPADLDVEGSPKRRVGALIGAIAALVMCLAALGGALVVLRGDDESTPANAPAKTTADVQQVCRDFNTATYNGVSGPDLVRAGNAQFLVPKADGAARVSSLADSLRRLHDGLWARGIDDALLDAEFNKADRLLAQVATFVNGDEPPRAASKLRELERGISNLQRELIRLRIVGCHLWVS
jgi:hypothetical protein